MLWQLKNIKTGEVLNEPQLLPENWGPIFGLEGFKEKLNDLSWIDMPDLGWFEVGPISMNDRLEATKFINSQIDHIIEETNKFVASDNNSVSKQERIEWLEYRKLIKEIPNQINYPFEINWPSRPDSK